MERLPFRLPDFVRVAWVSATARKIWEPRFRSVSDVLFTLQWASVRSGHRKCCKLVVPSGEFYERFTAELSSEGISCEPVQQLPEASYHVGATPAGPGERHHVLVAIGHRRDAQLLRDALRTADIDTELSLLGAHECCRSAFVTMWRDARFIDFTWPIAARTVGMPTPTRTIEIEHPSLASSLWKWVGIRMLFTTPCRFNCPTAIQSADEIARLGNELGHGQEIEWAREILTWPVEWSALHGIAEIRTPVCKIIAATDATPTKYTIRVHGGRLPSEGVTGLSFPYSKSSQRELKILQ
ncbi:MAG: hypothetical protein ACHRXM_16660 [Isosphaerales bacterium]